MNQAHSVVAAWEVGALSRVTMRYLVRRGEVLPEGRTNLEEDKLIRIAPGLAFGGPGQPRM